MASYNQASEDLEPEHFCYYSESSLMSGKVLKVMVTPDGKHITHFAKTEPDLNKSQWSDMVYVGKYKVRELQW